jgi:DNA polymerase-1
MALVNADAKGLEIVCIAYLSQDPVLMKELIEGVDIHAANMKAFNLPSRLIAKVFIFRLIYGGSAYSYTHDPDFESVGLNEKQWQKVIDAFYFKYKRIAQWHQEIVAEAMQNGFLTMPTGRIYQYELLRNYKGELTAPRTQILNFPVQGLGADLMSIARVSFYKRFKNENINGILINTVHDSIVVDTLVREVRRVESIFNSVFFDLPLNFKRIFGVEFNLPLKCEISVGPNMHDLVEIGLDNP